MVGASTPSQAAPGNRGQFVSRIREPASRLLPLMARTPALKPNPFFKHVCTMCATLCAGPLISQDLDRRTGSKRAHKGSHVRNPKRRALIPKDLDRRAASKRAQTRGVEVQNPMRGTPFSQDLDRGDGFETSSKKSSPMRNPMRGTPFSQDLDRGDGFEKETSRKQCPTYASYLRGGSERRGAGSQNSKAKGYARPYAGY